MSRSEPFVMILPRRPVSGNKTNRKYQSEVGDAARTFFGDRAPLTGALYSRIIWFHRVRQAQDVDNIPKQILDSLKQSVYEDDRLLRQCLVTDIDVRQEYELLPERISDQQLQELLELLGDENQEHILYVEIGMLERERVVFGPIDRGGQ